MTPSLLSLLSPPIPSRYEEKTCVGAAGGVGGSGDSKYHLKHVAADVMAMVDGLGIDTFHLFGHDWGRCAAIILHVICLILPYLHLYTPAIYIYTPHVHHSYT